MKYCIFIRAIFLALCALPVLSQAHILKPSQAVRYDYRFDSLVGAYRWLMVTGDGVVTNQGEMAWTPPARSLVITDVQVVMQNPPGGSESSPAGTYLEVVSHRGLSDVPEVSFGWYNEFIPDGAFKQFDQSFQSGVLIPSGRAFKVLPSNINSKVSSVMILGYLTGTSTP